MRIGPGVRPRHGLRECHRGPSSSPSRSSPGANTLDLTRRIDAELDAIAADLPQGVTLERGIFRQADFISLAVDNVFNRALGGCRAGRCDTAALPLERPHGGDLGPGHPPVALAGRPGASRPWRHHQHDDAGRDGDRDRSTRGRCGHLRRECPPAPRRQCAPGASSPPLGAGGHSLVGSRDPHSDPECDGHHHDRLCAPSSSSRGSRGGCSGRSA